MKHTKILSLILAALLATSLFACGKDTQSEKGNTEAVEGQENQPSGAGDIISMPEGEDAKEEIITNEDYANSELYDFTGTVDEIYDDGSILVYSPDFRVHFDYKVIVEFDENTVIDGFELSENQHIKFEVYSSVKKSEPLTVVAAKLTLLNQVSTQREEEAERIARLEAKVEGYKTNPPAPVTE